MPAQTWTYLRVKQVHSTSGSLVGRVNQWLSLTPSKAFSLVELLVVVAIISLLMALLLPAIQRVREAANRVRCANNLRQLGVGLHNFHDQFGRFPTANSYHPADDPTKPTFTSAFTRLLPYVEQDALERGYDYTQWPNADPPNKTIGEQPIGVFRCPSMIPPPTPQAFPGWSSYAVSIGTKRGFGTGYFSDPDDGVFVRHIPGWGQSQGTNIADILDGTSQTIFAGEMGFQLKDYYFPTGPYAGLLRGGNTQWVWGYASYSFGSSEMMFNTVQPNPSDPSDKIKRLQSFRSDHVGGAQFLFGDSTVRFLRPSMSLSLYQALTTRAGGEVIGNLP
mgnify:CR=1 FL=1